MKTLKDLDEKIKFCHLRCLNAEKHIYLEWKADIIERDKIIDELIKLNNKRYWDFTQQEDNIGCERADAKVSVLIELKKQLEVEK